MVSKTFVSGVACDFVCSAVIRWGDGIIDCDSR
jgi:hypothetical protein